MWERTEILLRSRLPSVEGLRARLEVPALREQTFGQDGDRVVT
jgi:hypothetical protein